VSPLDLPPDMRSRLRRLSLVPRRSTAQTGAGAHASRNRGGGLEFAQYRAYERGDDLRQVDWKLYARSDRFFVRDAERESPLALWIAIDASASMAQADLARPDWSRFDAARRIAAGLMEVALRQGDRFGVVVEAGDGPLIIEPGAGPRHRDQILLALERLRAGGVGSWARDMATFGGKIGRSDLVIVLTDGFDDDCINAAVQLAGSGRDLCLIRILTADERDFPFDQGHRFREVEGGAEILGDGRAMRDDFLARFAEARAALDARLDAQGVRHATHFIDQPADQPIRDLFRAGGRR
jgi:uncharacterized protein (DUF58 family)